MVSAASLSDEPAHSNSTTGRWWFSGTLLAVYLGTFQCWMRLPHALVLTSGLTVSAVLAALLLWNIRKGYFANRWDAFGHSLVIADLAIESVIIPEHDDRGFYFCALAFAVVVGGYRSFALRHPLERNITS